MPTKTQAVVSADDSWDGATVVIVNESVTAGSPVVLFTPTSGKKFRILSAHLVQAANNVRILLRYGSTPTTFYSWPLTAYTAPGPVPQVTFGLRGWAPGAVDDTLQLDVNTGAGVGVTGTVIVKSDD
jgi:hypothetical protein